VLAALVPARVLESMEWDTGRSPHMSQSSRCTTRKAWSEAKALACGTTRGIAGTTTQSMLLERSCRREMEIRRMCVQFAARTMR
jgi:hypothetical protein